VLRALVSMITGPPIAVRRGLCHVPRVVPRADAAAFTGEGDQIVMPTVIAAGADKAVGKDAV